MNTVTVPLDKLELSQRNVRTEETEVDDLVASITAYGLLNALTVTNGGDTYKVIAGGRRYRALKQLAEAGNWPGEVPVHVVEEDKAEQVSLAENFNRKGMSTLDVMRAMRTISHATECPETIATNYGVPMDRARKLARLSCLHANVFEAWADGDMTQEQAEAFAGTKNHDEQLRVLDIFHAQSHDYDRQARSIRKWLGLGDYNLRKILEYVGREAYEKAGGAIETDLFSEEVRICHPGLLGELAEHKKDKEFDAILERADRDLEYVGARPDNYYSVVVYPDMGNLSDEEEEQADACRALLSWDSEPSAEEQEQAESQLEVLTAKRGLEFPEGGRIACAIDSRGEPDFFWLERPEDKASDKAEKDEAEEDAIAPSKKAIDVMAHMKRLRLIDHMRVAEADRLGDALLFNLARAQASTNYHQQWQMEGVESIRAINPYYTELKWCTEENIEKAWTAFRKWLNDAKRNELTGQLLGQMANSAGNDYGQFLQTFIKPQAWQSSEEFWALFRKAQMLAMIEEIDPKIADFVRDKKQGDMRKALHDLFSERNSPNWKAFTEDQLEAIKAWVPRWVQFDQHKEAEA